MNEKKDKRPAWIAILVILCCLPVVMFPSLLGHVPADNEIKLFVWFYPVYVIVAGICAYMCWPTRKPLTVILLILLLLAHAVIWQLAVN